MGSGITVVCGACKSVVARTDRGLHPMGEVAAVSRGDASLSIGDKLTAGGKNLLVMGVTTYAHSAGGTWEEYTVYAGAEAGILSHAQGQWALFFRATIEAPSRDTLRVDARVVLGEAGEFRVAETGHGTLTGGEGELSRAAAPGSPVAFADLNGRGRAVASIDYGAEGGSPALYLGEKVKYSTFNIQRSGLRRGENASTKSYTCPKCGAPLDLLTGRAALSVSCKYCGTVSEPAGSKILAQNELEGRSSPIPLGTKGMLGDTTWTVVGYMSRSVDLEGETYSWAEYLLYEESQGFAWIVIDDEGTWFSQSTNRAELEVSEDEESIQFNGKRYTKRVTTRPRVGFVIGEFYWQVKVGETVELTDYAAGSSSWPSSTLAREESQGEVHWSHATRVDPKQFQKSFGLAADATAKGTKSGLTVVEIFVILAILGIFLAIALAMFAGDGGGSSGGSYSSGGVRGGLSGGFGGK